jgi:hypothetical protein
MTAAAAAAAANFDWKKKTFDQAEFDSTGLT